jgi:GTPase SAR1 family protein
MPTVNTRLQTLLDRCPLGEEDCHNIAVIFHALAHDKQQFILDNWDTYIIEMVMVRKEVDAANRALLEEAIEMIDTLKDAKNARDAQHLIEKFKKQKLNQSELEWVEQYQKTQKLNLIRSIGQFPDE